MKYSLWRSMALYGFKILSFQEQGLNIFQSKFSLILFKSIPIFDSIHQILNNDNINRLIVFNYLRGKSYSTNNPLFA